MENSLKITLIIVSAIIFLVLFGVLAYFQVNPSQTVSSTGIAIVKAVPDLVSVYFNVETEGETAKEATDKNAEMVDDLTVALIRQGFERKDIVTENFNVYPNYVWENRERKQEGYKANHKIKVKMSTEDSSRIGSVIDAGVDVGVGVSYINFELSQEKQNQYKAEALEKATEDARIKAEGIARGLGKSLGKIVSVSAGEFDYYPWRVFEATAGASAEEVKTATTNIQPGEQEISGRVSVVFVLK